MILDYQALSRSSDPALKKLIHDGKGAREGTITKEVGTLAEAVWLERQGFRQQIFTKQIDRWKGVSF
jgi:outer membrane receptor for Fe3+-dicitrate